MFLYIYNFGYKILCLSFEGKEKFNTYILLELEKKVLSYADFYSLMLNLLSREEERIPCLLRMIRVKPSRCRFYRFDKNIYFLLVDALRKGRIYDKDKVMYYPI